MIRTKQMLFCKYYVWEGCNATTAAKLAGYSATSARVTASRLITKANIQVEIKRQIKIREEKCNITDKRIIEELAMSAFSDPRDYYDTEGNLLPIIELSERAAKALAEFTVTVGKSGKVIKIKRDNKLKALETLARIHNMFYNDQDPNVSMKDRVIYYPVKVAEGASVDLTAKIEKPASKDN